MRLSQSSVAGDTVSQSSGGKTPAKPSRCSSAGQAPPHWPIMRAGFNYAQPAPWTLNLGPWRKATGYRRNDQRPLHRGEQPRLTRDASPIPTSPLRPPASFGIATHTHTPHTMLSSARTGASLALRGELRRMDGGVNCRLELGSSLPPRDHALPPRPNCCFFCCCFPSGIQANHPSSPNRTARPTTSLAPFRVAAAASLSSSARKDAGAVQPHSSPYGLAKHERREVPLPSQEGTKGLVQYALYVPSHFSTHRHAGACLALFRFSPPLTTTAAPAQPSTS